MSELTATATETEDEAGDSATAADAAGADAHASSPGVATGVVRVHRLRDLDRRGRLVAALFAAALVLGPVLAFAATVPRWAPANDGALMALRTLDVGTSRTPLTGQPSTSSLYDGELGTSHVDHLGPLHYYLMAVPARVLGAAVGMLVVSLVLTTGSLLLAAWAVFRQLGPRGGLIVAVALGLISHAGGARSLVDPVSSNIAGYPTLCAIVLLWCLICGDLRLLPVAVAVVSFAAQQHLSVLPSLGVAAALSMGVVAVASGRHIRTAEVRSRFARWAGLGAVVGLVLWAPVLIQQVFGNRPNLTALADFARDSDRPTLGWGTGAGVVARALTWPPLLGRGDVTGWDLLAPATSSTWLSAGLVLVAVAVAGWLWWRAGRRRQAATAAMVGVLVVAGLVGASSVLDSLEATRIVLYHWVWALLLFVILSLGLAAIDLVRARLDQPGALRVLRPLGLGAALLVIAVPAVLNPSADRRSNELSAAHSPVERRTFDSLGDQILAHRDELGDATVIIERGGRPIDGVGQGLSVELIERGLDVRIPYWPAQDGVHRDRVATVDTVDSALVLVQSSPSAPWTDPVPGRRVAAAATSDFDHEAFEDLVASIEEQGGPVELGADLEAYLATLDGAVDQLRFFQLSGLADEPRASLDDLWVVQTLLDHPPDHPQLDPGLLRRLLESSPGSGISVLELEVYLLDRDELLAYARSAEILGLDD